MPTDKPSRRAVLAALCAALCGCGTVHLKVAYGPSSPSQRLSDERLPRIYVDDASVTATMDIAMSWNRDAEWSPPAEISVRDALRAELARLGVPAADDARHADAVLHATLTECEFEMPHQAAPTGRVALALTLRTPTGATLWESTLTGRGRADHVWVDADQATAALSRALTAAIMQLGARLESEGVAARVFAGPPTPTAAARPASEPPVVRSDVDEPPAPRRARPRAHAIVLGVRRYQQSLPEADFADADARLVKRYLEALGYADAEIASAVDEQATKSAFEKYFEAWLPNRVEAGDEVFVYFSGHGAPNPRTGDAYLVPYDGDPTYLDKTAYPLKRLYSQLAQLPASKVTVVMDSCFSGAGGRSVLAKGARPLVTVSTAKDVPGSLTVLTASAGDQVSYALPEQGHGLFTYHLLKAIKAQTGADWDLRAAFNAAARQVAGTARRDFNAEQVPQWSGRR